MNCALVTLTTLIAIANAWQVKIAGAFGDLKCDITQAGSVWEASFKADGSADRYVLGSFSQKPTSCAAQKLNDDLVYSYMVSGTDAGELRVRVPNSCNTKTTPTKETVCGVTSVLSSAGSATADNDQGRSCGVPEGKCGHQGGTYCELYACTGTASACTANLLMASFSFDITLTPNAKCAESPDNLTDETSILAVGTPSGTPGGMSSCCAVAGKPTNAPASSATRNSALVVAAGVMAMALVF